MFKFIEEIKPLRIGKNLFFEENNFFKEFLNKNKKYKILDLGCGNGRFFVFFEKLLGKNFFEFLGVDREIFGKKSFIKKKYFLEEEIGDFLNENSFDEKFDIIICSGIFENYLEFDENILEKIYKFLEKNGVLFINFWNYGEDVYRNEDKNTLLDFSKEKILKKVENFTKGKEFSLNFYKKQRNAGWNIVFTLKR